MGPVTLKNRALTPEEARTLMEGGNKLLGDAGVYALNPVLLADPARVAAIREPDPHALDPRCDEAVRRFLGIPLESDFEAGSLIPRGEQVPL